MLDNSTRIAELETQISTWKVWLDHVGTAHFLRIMAAQVKARELTLLRKGPGADFAAEQAYCLGELHALEMVRRLPVALIEGMEAELVDLRAELVEEHENG